MGGRRLKAPPTLEGVLVRCGLVGLWLEWFLDCRVRVGYRRVGAWVIEKTLKGVSTIPRDAVTHKDIQPNGEAPQRCIWTFPTLEVISRMRMCHAHSMGRLVLRPSVSPWHMTSLALLHAESLTWPPRRARATCNCISLLHMRTRALEVANPQGWQVPILEARVAYAWLVL